MYFSVKYAIQSNDCDVFVNKQSIYLSIYQKFENFFGVRWKNTLGAMVSAKTPKMMAKQAQNSRNRQKPQRTHKEWVSLIILICKISIFQNTDLVL